ncbi:uncharacterized protein BCR38DRAFT_418765 [Pseudomassariella vexata]|uniref:ZW10 C-terminal helical domain-containing protein n=1 Tax=Pseudomassariella vexata TaxID=1141098 RepID=A0A1Y2EKJ7_9PEZI|nr:uncharacterized protein BCR38DRAFT_418765 [Pseudomassariella vexata]ORY72061.1 hypothetical protein BCR38DRAFT_418765 [Pseudomassariella vexata]
MTASESAAVGQALVDFALYGGFPEDELSSRHVRKEDFGPALEALAVAKSKLESEVRTINEETAPDVQSWVANAKTLEDDINRSRSLAHEIVRRSEAPEASGQTIREAEDTVDFLNREANYNQQVLGALTSIRHVNELLDQVEQARDDRRILESLHLLEKSWTALDQIPATKSRRIMRLLDMRAFELKSAVHDVFDHVWSSLVRVDIEKGELAIHETREEEQMSLSEAVIGLQAYKEVDQRMALLWHSVDAAIVGPRTNPENKTLPAIKTENHTLSIAGQADRSLPSLFSDLEQVMGYFSKRLPEELVRSLSNVMMPDLVPRIINLWLDPVIPVSLKDMEEFQEVISVVKTFCNALRKLDYSGFDELQDWVDGAPRVWLAKYRETALDSIRSQLAQGLGGAKQVERVETQQVSRSEGKELVSNGAALAGDDDDWGTAWGNDEQPDEDPSGSPARGNTEEDGADAWGWGEEDVMEENPKESTEALMIEPAEDDDAAAAWGWGDDDVTDDVHPEATSAKPTTSSHKPQTREMTLKETYNISSMPDPVLKRVSAILEDGASLVGSERHPVAAAAAGLFSLPTLILAMFRAVSPYYYALDPGGSGNMFLYNDATYLSERLSDLATDWKSRPDLAPRAVNMLRLDNDIKTLQSFAARAYATEMTTQRTVLRDLLGGTQNMLQQDFSDMTAVEAQVDSATTHVRSLANIWSQILSRSAWCQAVGGLADTVASKLVSDVMDMAGIGQDEAYTIASLISTITSLDNLFLPPGAENTEDAILTTAKYAANWLRLKLLSEVLQSNLNEVKYLWCEGDLSLHYTVEEVVDLIGLSFVDNARTREVVGTIRGMPRPRE